MKTVKTWIFKLEYDNTRWLAMQDPETHKTTNIKLSAKEYENMRNFGIPTAEEILQTNGISK